RSYPISAIYRDTPSEPLGPAVLPGEYTVKLSVNGKTLTQPLSIKMDPRVKTPSEGLAQQFAVAMQCWEGMGRAHRALTEVRGLRAQLRARRGSAGQGPLAEALAALDREAMALEGNQPRRGRRRGPRTQETS